MLDPALGIRIIFRPQADKLVEVVGPEYGPVSREIVKIVHDHRNKQVENKEATDNEETNEVQVGKIRATPVSFWICRKKTYLTKKVLLLLLIPLSSDLGSQMASGLLVQSNMISCQASPVADLNNTSRAWGKVWKWLFLWIAVPS